MAKLSDSDESLFYKRNYCTYDNIETNKEYLLDIVLPKYIVTKKVIFVFNVPIICEINK